MRDSGVFEARPKVERESFKMFDTTLDTKDSYKL